jgi:hypothetical protein
MATKDTNSQSSPGRVQSTVQSERMGRITSLKSFERTEDKWTGRTPEDPEQDSEFTKHRDQMKTVEPQEEPPIYDLTTTNG